MTATKRLIIVRHAKSSWEKGVATDFERPLNDRGKRDAPEMAKRLSGKKVTIDAVVASPAKRTTQTAEAFCNAFGKNHNDILFIPELYHAPSSTIHQVVSKLDDAFNTVILFSHNPGITDFVNSLTTIKIANMPTCAMFSVEAPVDHWASFEAAEKDFLFFDYPKNITD